MTVEMQAVEIQQGNPRLEHHAVVSFESFKSQDSAVPAVLIGDGAHALEAIVALRTSLLATNEPVKGMPAAFGLARSEVGRLVREQQGRSGSNGGAEWSNPLSALALLVDGRAVHLSWIGAVGALLLDGSTVIGLAAPHVSLVSTPDMSSGDEVEMLTRRLSGQDDEPESLAQPWILGPRRRVLCCTSNVLRRVSQDELGRLVVGSSTYDACLSIAARCKSSRQGANHSTLVTITSMTPTDASEP